MADVVCCVYNGVNSKTERIKLSSFDLSNTVENLKTEIAKHVAIATNEMQILSCGKLLGGGDTLESCGIKPGVIIHCVRKLVRGGSNTTPEKMDTRDMGLQSLVISLMSIVHNPAYRSTVRRLSKPDVWENIIAVNPGLANDSVAIAILQDPDLLMQLTDTATMQKAIETHPTLADAINQVVAAVHQDNGSVSTSAASAGAGAGSSGAANRAGLPGSFNLMWEMLYDDDFLPGDQANMSDIPRTPNQSENSPFPAITPAQLASALAAVATAGDQVSESNGGSQSNASVSPIAPSLRLTTATSTPQTPSTLLTPEIFSQAVQQAMNSTTAQSRLQQLRDMGITDDAASLRALEITNGDVQAALELIFGGLNGSEGFNDNGSD